MLYCYLDTNIFHEFKPITEIDWLQELDTSEVCLLVTSIVVQELDKHKAGNNNRLKKKARKWIAFLEGLDDRTDNELRQNVALRFDLSEPKDGTFNECNLSASVADDRLLAKALEFATQNKSDKVAVVSEDAAVRLKARGYDLYVPTLSEVYRLDQEADPLVQENRELKNKLLKLENSQPKLLLGFRDSMGDIAKVLHISNSFAHQLLGDAELNILIQKKRDKLEYVEERKPIDQSYASSVVDLSVFRKTITQSQIDKYNEEVEEYLQDYRDYRLQESRVSVFPHQSIDLDPVLQNEGATPARNVEVRLFVHGSSEIDVLAEVPKLSPFEPRPPVRPEPRSLFAIDPVFARDLSFFSPGLNGTDIDFGPPWEEWTHETNNSGLHWHEYGIKKLQHHRSRDLEKTLPNV